MAGESGARRTSMGCRMRDDQWHVSILLVHERPLALQAAMGTSQLAMIRGEHDNRIPPQLHFVQDIDNLLNVAITVLDGVQVVVVEDGPHVLASRRDYARPSV